MDFIVQNGGEIYFAEPSFPWPGVAAVFVSIVMIVKGIHAGEKLLGGKTVKDISSLLDTSIHQKPHSLYRNIEQAFRGMDVLGMGFTLSEDEARDLIAKNPKNKDVLFPFANGQDIYTNYDQSPSRWIIYFYDWPLSRCADGVWYSAIEKQKKNWLEKGNVPKDYPGAVADDYPDCLSLVRERVYPERQKNGEKHRREIWWQFDRPRIELFRSLQSVSRVLIVTLTSKTGAIVFMPSNMIFSHATGVFLFDDYAHFALLQSAFHFEWAWRYGSSLKGDLRYTPSDVFETFPFPKTLLPKTLEVIGETYHGHRRQIMLARQEGLTATYNRFHNPQQQASDIARLRELHMEMDQAVAAAYGWQDLELGHSFHKTAQGVRFTISEAARREVLARLLRLNHERYEEDVRMGLHEKKGKGATKRAKGAQLKAGAKKKPDKGQMGLF